MWKYKDIPNLKPFGYHLACFFEFLGYLEAETILRQAQHKLRASLSQRFTQRLQSFMQ